MSDKKFINRFSNEKNEAQSNTQDEVHISSFIVYCKPDTFASVAQSLKFIQSVEVHAEDPSGKFVVVIEGDSSKRILDVVENIGLIPGVFNTAMVYHQSVEADAADEDAEEFGIRVVTSSDENTELNQAVH